MTTESLTDYRNELKTWASKLRGKGLRVRAAEGKNPGAMGANWQTAEPTEAALNAFIDRSATPTIGILAGPYSPPDGAEGQIVVMVDIDSDEEMEAAKELFDGEIPPCWWANTGRGHRLSFRAAASDLPADRGNVHFRGSNGAKVMVQIGTGGKGAFSVLPPSRHYVSDGKGGWTATGNRYEWKVGHSPDAIPELPTLPDDVAKKLKELAENDAEAKKQHEAKLEGIDRKEGDPDTGVHRGCLAAMIETTKNMEDVSDGSKRLAVCMRRAAEHYLSNDCALATLQEYEEQTTPFLSSFTDSERLDRLRQAERSPDVTTGGALVELDFATFAPIALRGLSDDGNTERLVSLVDGDIKYVPECKQWATYLPKSGLWRFSSEPNDLRYMARKNLAAMVRAELQLAYSLGMDVDEEMVKQYENFAKSSANHARIRDAVKLAADDPAMRLGLAAFDSDPYLLGTPNGVLDLNAGRLLTANRKALLTKATKALFGDAAKATKFLEFLNETFQSDTTMIAYMQRLLGLSLIGKQLEHVLPVCYGSGANGKSVLFDTVSHVLGDYAAPLPDGLLTASRWDRHPTDIASLHGKRFCFAEETAQGAELDEAKVKRLTGGSALTARFVQKDFFTFNPSHSLFLMTNHKPEIRGTDTGIWRRIKVVSFDNIVPEEQRNPHLKNQLLDEQDHILAWLVEGCSEYLASGLQEPPQVQLHTEKYQQHSDPVRQFLSEAIKPADGGFLATQDIKANWEAWSQENDVWAAGPIEKRLREHYPGLSTNRNGKRGYKNLAFQDDTYALGV
ncbi:hypothetical protein KOR34_05200 [Posidoniimonas corsicana]|uniref:SF3 helicase domain-containing protein n=1 Tax=Posidoniimonas corsicana TaxID=1938618 RepID=A0A5C5VAJ9_9BACT|nr:phage/plasmid primase, P4 family [Posidoniimonas corsicana]TWT35626.1 hypothetical protein KOR34_05200 [Posidoniimonas corsicana]